MPACLRVHCFGSIRAWCCKHNLLGCPTTTPQSTLVPQVDTLCSISACCQASFEQASNWAGLASRPQTNDDDCYTDVLYWKLGLTAVRALCFLPGDSPEGSAAAYTPVACTCAVSMLRPNQRILSSFVRQTAWTLSASLRNYASKRCYYECWSGAHGLHQQNCPTNCLCCSAPGGKQNWCCENHGALDFPACRPVLPSCMSGSDAGMLAV